MPRTDEAEWWFNAVYDAVQQIPAGRVTSYGHIARLLGRRTSTLFRTGLALPISLLS
jgi:alkylated DNA nucleotide flippase Atl1